MADARPTMPGRWRRRGATLVLGAAIVGAAGVGVFWVAARDALGGSLAGERLARVQRSPERHGGRFDNARPRVDGSMVRATIAFAVGGSAHRRPDAPLGTIRRTGADYRTPPSGGLRVTWLGHSTVLVEIDGRRVLVDPMWSERASPVTFAGPQRFFAPPLPLDQLPAIDAVVISHDHYDHLDKRTVQALARRGTRWLVPLGIGAHLAAWGVPEAQITELDWWEAARVGELTITATPARHFSGRRLTDANQTLWAGWALAGPAHRVFYSGDTALHDDFGEIGRRLGPFDLTMIEVGEYDPLWTDVHLGPEQAVLAHQRVRGALMLPVHWATFDLALHGWTEPIERVLVAARAAGVRVVTPPPGGMVEPGRLEPSARWWPDVPWVGVAEKPVWSSGVSHAAP